MHLTTQYLRSMYLTTQHGTRHLRYMHLTTRNLIFMYLTAQYLQDLMAYNRAARPGYFQGGEAQGVRALYALIADRFA